MPSQIVGLHHVTAIASSPQKNLDFYTQVLGLRFVKRTVNFDDPGSYHFYFGNDSGDPGTILTFFAWPTALRGRVGAGETIATAFSVPLSSLPYWEERLRANGVAVERSGKRFEEDVLAFADPDGMKIEIVGHEGAVAAKAPRYSDVPPEHALRGFYGVTLLEQDRAATEKILGVMGFHRVAEEGNRIRYATPGGAFGSHVDLVIDPNAGRGRMGAGTVHHIAFRASSDDAQRDWQSEMSRYAAVTEVLDRTYFHSIYFREPGGVLFEIATDAPGFAIDEPIETLGEALKLPAWLEPRRGTIEQRVLPIELHKAGPAVEAAAK